MYSGYLMLKDCYNLERGVRNNIRFDV